MEPAIIISGLLLCSLTCDDLFCARQHSPIGFRLAVAHTKNDSSCTCVYVRRSHLFDSSEVGCTPSIYLRMHAVSSTPDRRIALVRVLLVEPLPFVPWHHSRTVSSNCNQQQHLYKKSCSLPWNSQIQTGETRQDGARNTGGRINRKMAPWRSRAEQHSTTAAVAIRNALILVTPNLGSAEKVTQQGFSATSIMALLLGSYSEPPAFFTALDALSAHD